MLFSLARTALAADEVALNIARENYKKVTDLATHILRVWGCWMKRYELATGVLHRSLEYVDSVVVDDIEFEVRQKLTRRRLACEEAFDQLETVHAQVEQLRIEKAEKVRVIMVRIELALAATMERARKAADDT
ncbi:hypothetical protein MMC34_001122 [Xylographa carneopallida]|nr:hypothetical protein [Xylographa carneopallida]